MGSSMTRQHFKVIAAFIRDISDRQQRARTCEDAVRGLRQFNSNFDRYRFEEACGINEEESKDA